MRTLLGLALTLSLALQPAWCAEAGSADESEGLLVQQPPTTPPRPPTVPTPRPTPVGPQAAAPTTPPPRSLTELASLPSSLPPEMLGDFIGRPSLRCVRIGANQFCFAGAPGRSFKVADNESPRPQDRVYFSFNYYDDVFESVHKRLGGLVRHMQVHRETIGFEKTLLGGDASIGLRLPLQTFDADSPFNPFLEPDTDLGDLSVLLKYALVRNDAGDVLSFGLAVTTPTGEFADEFHATTMQPWVGFVWTWGDWFLHGFTAVDVPTDGEDVTLLFNDYGVGYFVLRDREGPLTAVAPTVEVHVNTPLNHRGFDPNDPVGTSDLVDITAGVNLEFYDRARLALGAVVPVTGLRAFDIEGLAQLRLRF